jgi:hypothetical protein
LGLSMTSIFLVGSGLCVCVFVFVFVCVCLFPGVDKDATK